LRHEFTFAPFDVLKGKKPIDIVPNMSVKKAFFNFDTHGKYYNIAENKELLRVITTKASINFQIKEYAQERASGFMCYLELLMIKQEFGFPQWFVESVENQKQKLLVKQPKFYPSSVMTKSRNYDAQLSVKDGSVSIEFSDEHWAKLRTAMF
jgi:hypothetical protein